MTQLIYCTTILLLLSVVGVRDECYRIEHAGGRLDDVGNNRYVALLSPQDTPRAKPGIASLEGRSTGINREGRYLRAGPSLLYL